MVRKLCLILFLPVVCVHAAPEERSDFEYPSAILDLHDADGSCWTGMDAAGYYPAAVVPERWLVGAPPSEESAVTFPNDHWVDLLFSGEIVPGDGNDIKLAESGMAGEEALLFLTDGGDQEYLLTKVAVEPRMQQLISHLGANLDGTALPFAPRGIRLLALDLGGQAPGFDLANVQARVAHPCGLQGHYPLPVNGARDVRVDPTLSWLPGCGADQQVVYFSPVAWDVRADAASARYPVQDANQFDPPSLQLGETYYWRVDGLGGAGPEPGARGNIWSFTVADRSFIDDFESYDYADRPLWQVWDIWGRVSNRTDPLCHSCLQSMAIDYRCDTAFVSEVFREFASPQDWTRLGAQGLELMIHGQEGNDTNGQLYLAVGDADSEQLLPYTGDIAILTRPQWQAWRIPLTQFDDIDLTRVTSVAIGMRLLTTDPEERCRGTIYIDDIALVRSLCLDEGRPEADLTLDCAVDALDLQRMAQDWLDIPSALRPVAMPNEPILWYTFDGNTEDISGQAHGQVQGRPVYREGVYGQAIHFVNAGDAVTVPQAASVFSQAQEAITITFWQFGDNSGHLNDTVCCSNYVYGQSNPSIAIHLGCWRNPGQYRWDCGYPWSFANRLAGGHGAKAEWAGRWNHWAFTKDTRVGPAGRRGRMEIYLNGELYDQRTGTQAPITNITSFEIGSGWYGPYDGSIDDFQIYDYALSAAEIAFVATDGTGLFPYVAASPADLNDDRRVDLDDFGTLAQQWLEVRLWP